MTETTVVLTDLHANARALRAALALARAGGVDRWIVLGDLLTYGVDVDEVLDLVEELHRDHGAVVLRGNHDQLYLDLAAGARASYDRLPAWLREAADHTLARLDAAAFARRFAWHDELIEDGVLFSHANPFGAGDWRYLRDEPDLAAAAARLDERGLRVGVFGHSHRARMFVDRAVAITVPSLGQPRDRDGAAGLLRLRRDGARLAAELVPVAYDVAGHVAGLRASGLSPATVERLCGFFVPGLPGVPGVPAG